MEPYIYERLQQPSQEGCEIRFAQLRQGKPSDDLRVIIHKYPFSLSSRVKTNQLPFQALSYTWGDLSDTEKIAVETGQPQEEATELDFKLRYITVTKSLTEALRYIRSAKQDYILWIDAICIDQGTDEAALQERAWQVRLMHHIYSSAAGVIIWLGPEADDSQYAIQYLRELGSSISVDWQSFAIITRDGIPTEPMRLWRDGSYSSRENKSVADLLERPWFTRVWIKQEALLANEDQSLVLCGVSSVQLHVFRKAVHCVTQLGFDVTGPDWEQQQHAGARAAAIVYRHYSDAPNLMSRVRQSQCYDARDKVYGNLGIIAMNDDTRLAASIHVDYSEANTTRQVYMNFFKRYHERYSTLRLLSDAGLCQGSEMRPTWLPDWRTANVGLDSSLDSANSHFARAECTFNGDDVLEVLGVSAAFVDEAYMFDAANWKVESEEWYVEVKKLLVRWSNDQARSIFMDRFVRALYSPVDLLKYGLEMAQNRRENVVKYFETLLDNTDKSVPPTLGRIQLPNNLFPTGEANDLHHAIRFFKINGMPVLRCREGHIGVGCIGARPGDIVAAILGSKTLMLLRPVDEGKFQVVGPCAFHGLNRGEAILGPVPEGYIVEPQYLPFNAAYKPMYVDTRTGSASMWDPRIAWDELEVHPSMQLDFWGVPAPPGEPLRIMPDSAYLRRHGVQVETFNLI